MGRVKFYEIPKEVILHNIMKEVIDENVASLISETEEEYREASRELAELIADFIYRYNQLKKKYPTSGFGDTATDEAVVQIIYDWIHME